MKKIIFVCCLALVLCSCDYPMGGVSDGNYVMILSSSESSSESSAIEVMAQPTIENTPEESSEPDVSVVKKGLQPIEMSDEELEAIDNTSGGYGQGLNFDDENKPLGATSFNEKYNKYNAIAIGETDEKVIYLSFDEGYENGFTASILDTLKERNVKATFFLTGHYAEKETELVQRMVDEGHTLGNHGTNHKSLAELLGTSIADAENELNGVEETVREKYGVEMTLMRPPEGVFSERSLALAYRMGYTTMFWSFAYKDWEVDNQPDPTESLQRLCDRAHPGAVYLLHPVSSTNTEILGEFIDKMSAEGYTFDVPTE